MKKRYINMKPLGYAGWNVRLKNTMPILGDIAVRAYRVDGNKSHVLLELICKDDDKRVVSLGSAFVESKEYREDVLRVATKNSQYALINAVKLILSRKESNWKGNLHD